MAENGTPKPVLTDEEKFNVLHGLKNKLTPAALANDNLLASELSEISNQVQLLSQTVETTSDLNFTVNLVDYTADCVVTHLESNDPNQQMFQALSIANGETLASWCPRGYSQLAEITKFFRPVRVNFQKFITLKDLEESSGEPKEIKVKERKKRISSQLKKAPVVVPKEITAPEDAPSHESNLKTAFNVLKKVTMNSPIPFFRFVLNPRSFVQSVYNIFLVSFLVHEKIAVLDVLNDELLIKDHNAISGKNIVHESVTQCAFKVLEDTPVSCAFITDNYEILIKTPFLARVASSKDENGEEGTVNGDSKIMLIQSLSPKLWIKLIDHMKIDCPILPEFCPKDSPYFDINQLNNDLAKGVTFLDP